MEEVGLKAGGASNEYVGRIGTNAKKAQRVRNEAFMGLMSEYSRFRIQSVLLVTQRLREVQDGRQPPALP